VIVPVYNDERIQFCINSILNQKYPRNKYEIIVVKNCSPEKISSILRNFKHEVNIVEEHRKSSYLARNTGIKMAAGDLLAFTDADCIQAANWLEEIEASFNLKNISAVQGISYGINKNYFSELIDILNIYNITKKRNSQGYLSSLNTRNCAIRKSAMLHFFFNEHLEYWGDFVLGMDIARSGGKITLNKSMTNYHYNQAHFLKYIKKSFNIGKSISKSISKNPEILELYLNFLKPFFKQRLSMTKKIKINLALFFQSFRFLSIYYRKKHFKSIGILVEINNLSFKLGLNQGQFYTQSLNKNQSTLTGGK